MPRKREKTADQEEAGERRTTVESSPQEASDEAAPDFGEIFASWEFPDYEKHERSKRWYVISVALVIVLLLFAYWDKNPLLAVIVILGIIIFIVSELRGVAYHGFAITEDGIIAGQVFHAYENIKNFYVIYKPPLKKLYIEFKTIWRPRISIPLEDQDPVRIRGILLNYIPEDLEKEDEPISDFLGKLFKF